MTFFQSIKYFLRVIFFPNSLRTMEWKMLKLVNKDRKDAGLAPLMMQDDLRDVARKHSQDMARKDYFEHENTKGQTPFDRLDEARVTDIIAGENLAKIKGYKNAVQQAEIGLMNSPGHKANILHDEYNVVGIGVIKSTDGTYYYTQNFARRDLIFTKKISKKVNLKKGLRLQGETLVNVNKIIYQVKKQIGQRDILNEGIERLKNKNFDFIVHFKNTGFFDVLIYTNKDEDGDNFKIANKFEVRVKKTLFW
ncbi:CAP domain-containing protein [Patescibacteria group bacterium]|nr:CAP domain-containing protein [Patescibacteria group bacterium]